MICISRKEILGSVYEYEYGDILMCRGNVPISDPLSLKPSGAEAFGLIVRRKSFYHYLNIFLSRFSLSLLIPFTIAPKFDTSQPSQKRK